MDREKNRETALRFRKHADEARASAAKAQTPSIREEFLQLAARFDELANELEALDRD